MRILCALLVMLLAAGCGKDDAASVAAAGTFQGTIRAKQRILSPFNISEVTYVIGDDEIRREEKSTNIVVRLTGSVIAGVICRPKKNEAILYCSGGGKKRYCTLNLENYREIFLRGDLMAYEPPVGVGSIYLGIPEASRCKIDTLKEPLTLQGHVCDQHVLRFEKISVSQVTIATDHTPEIRVPRDLFLLVEPGIPASITGFPLRVQRVEDFRLLQQGDSNDADRLKRWLSKAARLAGEGIKKALESGLEVLDIDASPPDKTAFDLSPDYTEVKEWSAFEQEFSELRASSHHDWDD